MSEKLKPCPFCGGKAKIQHMALIMEKFRDGKLQPPLNLYFVACSNCEAQTFPKDLPEEACKSWNDGYVFE